MLDYTEIFTTGWIVNIEKLSGLHSEKELNTSLSNDYIGVSSVFETVGYGKSGDDDDVENWWDD